MSERYVIKGQLGAGRAGPVYDVYDTDLDRRVAMRRFDTKPQLYKDEVWCLHYFDVVSDLSSISHTNILSVLDAGIDENGPYQITTHVEGVRISQILKRQGSFEMPQLHALAEQCLLALQAAEEFGFYHHALSPSSVVCSQSAAGAYHFTMLDLGHSRLIPLIAGGDEKALSLSMDPALMAPEVYEGNPQGVRSSLYMLGHLFYWVAAGGHPLAGLPLSLAHAKHKAGEIPYLRAYCSDMPEAFRKWIYWLIEPEPAHRPASVAAALRSLPSLEVIQSEQAQPQPIRFDEDGVRPDYRD